MFASTVSLALSPLAASVAQAQSQGGYQPDYPQQGNYPPPAYQQPDNGPYGGPDQGDMPPPPGYDGTRPPPPPPGYEQSEAYAAQQQADERYAYEAGQWSRRYCVKAHGNVGAGAVVGGIFGAIMGGGLAGRGDRGVGTFAGAAIGAAGGAAIAGSSDSNATSPGCPPGYVVRGGAPVYAYGAPGYYYAAPAWYRPWVFIGGAWVYRPYPYHDFYYRRYHGDWHGGDRGGWHGDRGGWHGGYRDGWHDHGGYRDDRDHHAH